MRVDADRDEDEIGEYGDYDAPDDFAGPDDPSAYWRRRFIILAAGIAALGLCAWLFPGGHLSAARPTAAAHATTARAKAGSALPSSAYGTAWPGLTANGSSPAAPGAEPSPRASASHPAPAKPKKTAQPAQSAPLKKARKPAPATATAPVVPRCAPADIVLSLFTSQASYGPQAAPDFSVYAVSTSATACALSYGAGSVQVIVTSHGHVVWDSAACQPPAARKVRFTLGVPRVLTLSWNRRAANPAGCAGSLPAGAGGTFDAVALTAGQTSSVHPFRLER